MHHSATNALEYIPHKLRYRVFPEIAALLRHEYTNSPSQAFSKKRPRAHYGTQCYSGLVSPTTPKALSVLKSKAFARFQKKAKITDTDLWSAAQDVERGIIDADLGGGVLKQRLPRAGEGKSGGSRSIILFCRGSRAVYVYGFEKKDRANIKADELEAFRELATIILGYTDAELAERVRDGALMKVQAPEEESNA